MPVHDGASCLLCRVGGVLCALPLEHVEETMRPLTTEPVAGVPAMIRGLAVVRGRPTPVVDAASLVNGDSTHPNRFVTMKIAGRRVALAVDTVVGIQTIASGTLQQLPPLLRHGADAIEAVGTLDTELLLVLQSARLVPDEAWEALQKGGALT